MRSIALRVQMSPEHYIIFSWESSPSFSCSRLEAQRACCSPPNPNGQQLAGERLQRTAQRRPWGPHDGVVGLVLLLVPDCLVEATGKHLHEAVGVDHHGGRGGEASAQRLGL